MDPASGLIILGTAVGSAKTIEKILGPTAEYIGSGLKGWTERRVENVARIFENAKEKLGSRIDAPGQVPPKVLKGILSEGAYCDDELGAEYFGGVLASSRTEVGRDDRGATFIALLGRISSYQLRSHFYYYSLLRQVYEGVDLNLGIADNRKQLQTFVPLDSWDAAMEFSEEEDGGNILNHVMDGLAREVLIDNSYSFGSADHIARTFENADVPGIVFYPTSLGISLYLWSHGMGHLSINDFLYPDVVLHSGVRIPVEPGIKSVHFKDRGIPPPDSEEKREE